jgi:hypothetical protein
LVAAMANDGEGILTRTDAEFSPRARDTRQVPGSAEKTRHTISPARRCRRRRGLTRTGRGVGRRRYFAVALRRLSSCRGRLGIRLVRRAYGCARVRLRTEHWRGSGTTAVWRHTVASSDDVLLS